MLDRWFAQPEFLLTLIAVPVAASFMLFAHLRRRRALAQLGNSPHFRAGILVDWRVRRWKSFGLLAALTLLALACARPQWGLDPTPRERGGRDVVLVLDLSRSMMAEQPDRRELAVRSLRHLADAFEHHGGNRVALVIFASRAKLLFPLTQDYDHLRHCLTQIEADDYPSLSADDVVSGTRIGAALKLAVAQVDSERGSRPLLVLLSDGDDPAGADEEWLGGVMEAKKKRLRVHVVGIGDPKQAHTIPVGKERLEYEGQTVRTQLNELRLQEIAERTGGIYLPAHTQALPLGTFVQYLLDADALREVESMETDLPVYLQRYAWFLLPAVLSLLLTMFLDEGPVSVKRSPWRFSMKPIFARVRERSASPTLGLILTALVSISAAPAPSVESLLRQGNEAFERQEYEAALKLYEEAEPATLDPGLIAFNKGAVYYRLTRYREAIDCYRRCLEDDQAPASRRARASFDLGNALLKEAGDNPDLLAQSASAYRACLSQPALPPALRQDARHNLELAQMLWLRALAQRQKDPPKNAEDPAPHDPAQDTVKLNDPAKAPGDEGNLTPADPGNKDGSKSSSDPGKISPSKSKDLSTGTIRSLPDQEPVISLSREDALATLDKIAERIADQRRRQRHPAGPRSISTKDW